MAKASSAFDDSEGRLVGHRAASTPAPQALGEDFLDPGLVGIGVLMADSVEGDPAAWSKSRGPASNLSSGGVRRARRMRSR